MINVTRITRMLALIVSIFLVSGAAHAQGDTDRGRELATDCAACHGADGNSPSPAFPILAGQHEQYLFEALKAYQARSRNNAIMGATIIGKSDQQLKDLEASINNTDCDSVVIGTPIDLQRIVDIKKPSTRVYYDLQEIGQPSLEGILNDFVIAQGLV